MAFVEYIKPLMFLSQNQGKAYLDQYPAREARPLSR